MRTTFRTATVLALLCLAPARAVDAQTIDTRTSRSSVSGGNGIFGQSFTVDASYPVLNDFSVFVAGYPTAPSLFTTYIYAFDGSSLVGPALFTSALQTATAPAGVLPYPEFNFSTSGLALTPGGLYMAVIQAAGPDRGLAVGYARPTPSTFGDVYSGGQFYGSAYSTNPQAVSYSPISFAPGNDLEFVAHFSATAVTPTPEPASLTLLATGLAGVVGAVHRRRKTSSAG